MDTTTAVTNLEFRRQMASCHLEADELERSLQHFYLSDAPMPKSGRYAQRSLAVNRWGVTFVAEQVAFDCRDLAAQSAEYKVMAFVPDTPNARWEWTICREIGDRRFYVIDKKITAIGGLCGSFGDCYYPKMRRFESKFVGKHVNMRLETEREKFFPDTIPVLVSPDHRWILALGTFMSKKKFFEDPILVDFPLKIEQGKQSGYHAWVSPGVFQKLKDAWES